MIHVDDAAAVFILVALGGTAILAPQLLGQLDSRKRRGRENAERGKS